MGKDIGVGKGKCILMEPKRGIGNYPLGILQILPRQVMHWDSVEIIIGYSN